ncbi:hypothetical protein [Stratiformator vulcanicus]|uniref:DUF4252 domain-containing protein n=1 Tax=Stratiformator vulcanicus TaxID=2527980 RepID=A0A517R2Q7_9PLAN|nr:hypothetical protein [Stratiformator vulcanicus]QDT38167.1 hypothetical protein Pan189_25570 [Stratiformator vulcanicus]
MKRISTLLALVLFGCTPYGSDENAIPPEVLAALRNSDQVALYSLDPHPHQVVKENLKYYPLGNESAVIDSMELTEPRLISSIADALEQDVAASSGLAAGCFLPRHALKFRTEDDHIAEIVICYECLNAVIAVDEKPIASVLLSGTSAELLNRIIDDAEIERATPSSR